MGFQCMLKLITIQRMTATPTPENDCYTQDSENGKVAIMMWLGLVKTVVGEEANSVK